MPPPVYGWPAPLPLISKDSAKVWQKDLYGFCGNLSIIIYS